MVGFDRGAKAAADAGRSCRGIATTSSSDEPGEVTEIRGPGYMDVVDAMRCDAMVSGGFYLFPSGVGPAGRRWWREQGDVLFVL